MDHPFTYDALTSANHIRVLTLAPSEKIDAVLQCSLDQQHVDDLGQEYEAISYTWGDQERTRPMRCNGTVIIVTRNLRSALLCFRSRTTPRRLWADAICINQDDPEEKGQQISLMARIFRSASLVRVWLGDGDEGESRALADIGSLVKRIKPARVSANVMEHQDPAASDSSWALFRLKDPVNQIFSMPWFGRRWIVQELVMNGNVIFHCGTSQIRWPALHFAFHSLSNSPYSDERDAPNRRKIRQFGNLWRTWCFGDVSTMERGIYSLLRSFQDLECKESKDKLYAIAGLADDIELELPSSTGPPRVTSVITPSYDPMVSVDEVLQDLAFKLIRSGKVFDTLAHAGASGVMGAERPLPSWVPDVRKPGVWPVIAREGTADFKLLGIREPRDGTLTLSIEIWGFDPGKLDVFRERPTSPILRHNRPRPRPTVGDWLSLTVLQVFTTPEEWLPSDEIATHLKVVITSWLMRSTNITISHDVDHMLWTVVRSQLLTDDDPERLDRLGSFAHWKQQIWNGDNGDQSPDLLLKALSNRTLYYGEYLGLPDAYPYNPGYFGYGPRGLSRGDTILIPSSVDKTYGATALFLRLKDNGYQVLGGGHIWVQGPVSVLETRDVEIRLI